MWQGHTEKGYGQALYAVADQGGDGAREEAFALFSYADQQPCVMLLVCGVPNL